MMHLADLDLEFSPLNAAHIEGGIPESPNEKVCIFAAGLGRNDAPLDRREWDVWALNLVAPLDSAGRVRADIWFDLHQRCAQTEDDMRWIAKCPVPMYVPDDLADVAGTVAFPLQILDLFPPAPMACTFAYQIALAIVAGYKTIGLYGVELAYGDEREATVEWASVNWWIGYAQGLGIEILRPEQTRLGAHPYLYGFDYEQERDSTAHFVRMRERWHRRMDG